MRVVVAGAGAFGATIAVSLARAGATVTVADPGAPGANASGVAAGMLAPAFESLFDRRPEHFAMLMRARDRWPAFAASLGIEIERPATLAVSFDEDRIEGWRDGLEGLGIAASRVSSADVSRSHPGLAGGLRGVSAAEDWRLDPRRALAALRAEADRLGVEFRTAEVRGFTPGHAELGDGGVVSADALVIATGASAGLTRLAPELSGLTPIKGHILEGVGNVCGPDIVRFEGGYICPMPGGVRLGATMESGRRDLAIDPDEVAGLRELGTRYAPIIAGLPFTARVGVRAATVDGLALVGPSETHGVWLAVGARRNGWLLAPSVGETLVDLIMGEIPRGLRRPALHGKAEA